MNLEWLVGLRYIFNKNTNSSLITWIATVAVIGIMLSSASLTLVLNVMNGVHSEIKRKTLEDIPHITIKPQKFEDLDYIKKTLYQFNDIEKIDESILRQGVLQKNNRLNGVLIRGVQNNEFNNLKFNKLNSNTFNIAISEILAEELNLKIGNDVILAVDELNQTPTGPAPRIKKVKVSQIISKTQIQGVLESKIIYLNINDASKLWRDEIPQITLKLKNPDNPTLLKNKLSSLFPELEIIDWVDLHPNLFVATKLEKRMTMIMLSMMILISTFNLFATLMMLVNQKRSDIAVMRTLGASTKSILTIFFIPGFIIGALGVTLGVILGLLLTINVSEVLAFLENTFSMSLIPAKLMYDLDKIPTKIEINDLFNIVLITMILSSIITFLPSWRASKIQPMDVLKYE